MTPTLAPAAEGAPAPLATPTQATPTPGPTAHAEVVRQPAPLALVLNGRDQVAEFTVVIAVDDIAPGHGGWVLALQMDQFRTNGAQVRSLPAGAISLASVTISCASSPCVVPGNRAFQSAAMPAGVSRPIVVAAPGDGYGDFVVTATFEVVIPANAYAGTYRATAEVALSTGR